MSSAVSIEDRELALLDGLVSSIVEARSAIASFQALEVTLLAAAEALADEQTSRLAAAAGREREMPRRSIAAEIGAATRASDRTVQRRMCEAGTLIRDFPATARALGTGRIDRAHVSVIVECGGMLTDAEVRADFETAALALAERETPSRLRPLLRTLAARLDPLTIDVRHAGAMDRRGVWVADLDDGMAQLVAVLPAAIAHAIRDRLTRFAHTVIDGRDPEVMSAKDDCTDQGLDAAGEPADTSADDPTRAPATRVEPSLGGSAESGTDQRTDQRNVEQLRADVLADLLLAGDPTAAPRSAEPIVASVQVIVPALTLLGQSAEPAELVGHAPIDSATARRLAGTAAGWDRILTHPVTGAVLTVDRYRPSPDQRRLLRVRDEHCRFPGCRMPVHRCDIDHTIDAARGGPTTTCNLAHLCRRHHSLKHATDWVLTQHPDGTLEWTSPTGRTHLDRPPGIVRFEADIGPPPF